MSDLRASAYENADVRRYERRDAPGLIAVRDALTRDGKQVRRGITRVRADSSFAIDHPDLFVKIDSARGQDALRSATATSGDGRRLAQPDNTRPGWEL